MQARSTDRGLVVTVRDVLFDTAQHQLQPGARRSAAQLAAILQQHPQRRIRVEGFADSRGSETYNLALSQRRAEAFRDALVENGVPADRIDVQGLGEAFPVATNATAPAGSRIVGSRWSSQTSKARSNLVPDGA